nr:dipeptidyl peptidase 3 [Anolis sagrei ordinatus]
MVDSQYVLPNDIGIATLDCAEAFRLLSPEERLYAHYLSRACWYGGLVVLLQTSPESPAIYALISRLFRTQDPTDLGETAHALGLSDEEYQAFLVYAAAVYANMGNYKSFGDTKFVPNLPKEKLKQLVWKSQAFKDHPEEMEALWGQCGDLMFSLEPTQKHLGLCGQVSCPLTKIYRCQVVQCWNISAYNTRLFKKEVDGKVSYEVRLASVCSDDSQLDADLAAKMKCFPFGDCEFSMTLGDYAPLLQKVVENLQKAQVETDVSFPLPKINPRTPIQNLNGPYPIPASSNCQDKRLDLYIKWKGPSFEVQVGLHELLGHGSGKLFVQFSCPSSQIRSWYRGGETWDSKFSSVASSYEECRAECVGLYLCLNKEVLGIFELEGEDAEDVIYINWLNMVRAGVLALEFYTPESGSWRQAHMQARFVILRVLLEAGGGLVSLRHTTGTDGKPDAVVSLDRSKISTVGKPALERFLRKLQVLKSTADVAGGRALYETYSAVTDKGPERFLTLRHTVLLRKEARKLFVQANTRLEGDDVVLVQYESSAAGLIRSFRDRFPDDGEVLERHLMDLAHADAHFWGK